MNLLFFSISKHIFTKKKNLSTHLRVDQTLLLVLKNIFFIKMCILRTIYTHNYATNMIEPRIVPRIDNQIFYYHFVIILVLIQ